MIAHLQGTRTGARALRLDGTPGQMDRPWPVSTAASSPGRSERGFWVATPKRCAAPSMHSSHRVWPPKRTCPVSPASAACAGSTGVGSIQAGLERIVELKERARRQAGRGLIHRGITWQTVRLSGAHFR